MKRYITGILAVVIAVCVAAFSKPKPAIDMYVFQYSGNFTQASVEALGSWSFVAKNASLCNNIDNKACRVEVTAADVDNPLHPTALSSSVDITASSTGGTEYVTSITGTSTALASNQSE